MFRLEVDDVFRIRNRGVVATGRVASGAVNVGDTVDVRGTPLVVKGVDMFRKKSRLMVSGARDRWHAGGGRAATPA